MSTRANHISAFVQGWQENLMFISDERGGLTDEDSKSLTSDVNCCQWWRGSPARVKAQGESPEGIAVATV